MSETVDPRDARSDARSDDRPGHRPGDRSGIRSDTGPHNRDIGVVLTVHIAAPPEVVWTFWTDPSRMTAWWGEQAVLDPRPNGEFVVSMGADAPTMRGRYRTLEPPHRLVFDFGWDPSGDEITNLVAPGSTSVEVVLEPAGDGTELTLRHHGLPTVVAVSAHRDGWQRFVGGALPDAVHHPAD